MIILVTLAFAVAMAAFYEFLVDAELEDEWRKKYLEEKERKGGVDV